jgi:hypothetical protein
MPFGENQKASILRTKKKFSTSRRKDRAASELLERVFKLAAPILLDRSFNHQSQSEGRAEYPKVCM